MPTISNNGIRVHYEVVGAGPPLVLQHGLTQRIAYWQASGYVEALGSSYRLVMIDARGHGDSDKPYDPHAYRIPTLASDVLSVMDALELGNAVYWGYSLGAAIGFGLGAMAPERFTGFILGASSPYARTLPRSAQLDGADDEAFVKAFLKRLRIDPQTLSPDRRELLMANDFRAIAAAQQDRPSLAEALPRMTMPCLLYAGDIDAIHEAAERAASELPDGRFVSLPGLDHGATFRESGQILPVIVDFLDGIRRTGNADD